MYNIDEVKRPMLTSQYPLSGKDTDIWGSLRVFFRTKSLPCCGQLVVLLWCTTMKPQHGTREIGMKQQQNHNKCLEDLSQEGQVGGMFNCPRTHIYIDIILNTYTYFTEFSGNKIHAMI